MVPFVECASALNILYRCLESFLWPNPLPSRTTSGPWLPISGYRMHQKDLLIALEGTSVADVRPGCLGKSVPFYKTHRQLSYLLLP